MKEKLACSISPVWRKVAPTFEDIVSENQKPIPLETSLALLMAELEYAAMQKHKPQEKD